MIILIFWVSFYLFLFLFQLASIAHHSLSNRLMNFWLIGGKVKVMRVICWGWAKYTVSPFHNTRSYLLFELFSITRHFIPASWKWFKLLKEQIYHGIYEFYVLTSLLPWYHEILLTYLKLLDWEAHWCRFCRKLSWCKAISAKYGWHFDAISLKVLDEHLIQRAIEARSEDGKPNGRRKLSIKHKQSNDIISNICLIRLISIENKKNIIKLSRNLPDSLHRGSSQE